MLELAPAVRAPRFQSLSRVVAVVVVVVDACVLAAALDFVPYPSHPKKKVSTSVAKKLR